LIGQLVLDSTKAFDRPLVKTSCNPIAWEDEVVKVEDPEELSEWPVGEGCEEV
jgi:hypothetical protein